ncbi:hypothetical protein F503_00637 [Ophiostoma piceae UAMH 11346]|uniref:Uncharacterized protein n=1 Tax=Ophiostoma piceae (strain UAMH 11346) TaxID=1262450 RepID=S3D3J2_OPHP1|nr:hypothetical protein F503_00637 [Ophiostoma piceae UAMH 11346]
MAFDTEWEKPKSETMRGSARRRKNKNGPKKDQGSSWRDKKKTWNMNEDPETPTSAYRTGFEARGDEHEMAKGLSLRGGIGPSQEDFFPGREPSSFNRTNIYEHLPDMESAKNTTPSCSGGSGTQASGKVVQEDGSSCQGTRTSPPGTEYAVRQEAKSRPSGAGPEQAFQEAEAVLLELEPVLQEAQVDPTAAEGTELSIFLCIPQKKQGMVLVNVPIETVTNDIELIKRITEGYHQKRGHLTRVYLTVKAVLVAQICIDSNGFATFGEHDKCCAKNADAACICMPPQSLVDCGMYKFTPVKFRLPHAVDGFDFEEKSAPVSQKKLIHAYLSGGKPGSKIIYNSVPKFCGKLANPVGHEQIVIWGLVFEEKTN